MDIIFFDARLDFSNDAFCTSKSPFRETTAEITMVWATSARKKYRKGGKLTVFVKQAFI